MPIFAEIRILDQDQNSFGMGSDFWFLISDLGSDFWFQCQFQIETYVKKIVWIQDFKLQFLNRTESLFKAIH